MSQGAWVGEKKILGCQNRNEFDLIAEGFAIFQKTMLPERILAQGFRSSTKNTSQVTEEFEKALNPFCKHDYQRLKREFQAFLQIVKTSCVPHLEHGIDILSMKGYMSLHKFACDNQEKTLGK